MRKPRDMQSLANLHIVCLSRNNIDLTKIINLITAQKMKFSVLDLLSKCDQIRIWSHLLKKCHLENFIFCALHSKETCRH